jgi:CxxC-x17-CxxC domain-containing protein
MEEPVRDAVFGNVGSLVSFRVGAEDGEWLEREFSPEFLASDLVNLPKYNVYLKLMIDGITGPAFSARTLPPIAAMETTNREKIIKVSRERYGTPKEIVEDKIARWTGNSSESYVRKEDPPKQQPQTALYDAKCSQCGKWTKVIFPPDGSRPIYCKPCLKKIKEEREAARGSHGNPPSANNPAPVHAPVQSHFPAPGNSPVSNTVPAPIPNHAAGMFSLKEAFEKGSVPFAGKPFNQNRPGGEEYKRPKRKEVNLDELKKTLEESLENINEEKKKDEKPAES